MLDAHDLSALLRAYIGGEVLARKVLLDALDEAGDPRIEVVRAEGVDWDALARELAGGPHHWVIGEDQAYMRWLIDCARFGSSTKPEVMNAVRAARRKWLQQLFPELEL